MKKHLLIAFLCIGLLSLQAQTDSSFHPIFKWQFIVQNKFEASLTDSVDVQNKYSADPVNTNFRIRRFVLRSDITFTPKLTGTIRLQIPELKTTLPGRVIELAYANYKFKDAFQVRAGQFLDPFELDEQTSYDNLRMIERGTTSILFVNSNLASYQPGLMLHGNLFKTKKVPVNYYLAVVNGSDRSVLFDDNGEKNFIGRLEVYPVKTLRLGFSDQVIGLNEETGNAYDADISLQQPLTAKTLMILEAEYVSGTSVKDFNADTSSVKDIADFNMSGYNGQILFKITTDKKWCKVFEVGGKYEHADPRDIVGNNAFNTITGDIAFNFLPDNKARLQLNYIHTAWESVIGGSIDAADMFVAQFQFKL